MISVMDNPQGNPVSEVRASTEELITRLENAVGPNRETDVLIAELMFAGEQYKSVHQRGGEWCIRYYPGPPGPEYHRLPRYTASIDDALSLVPNALVWTRDAYGEFVIIEWRGNGNTKIAIDVARSKSLPAASLKARIATGTTDTHRESVNEQRA